MYMKNVLQYLVGSAVYRPNHSCVDYTKKCIYHMSVIKRLIITECRFQINALVTVICITGMVKKLTSVFQDAMY